MYEMIDELMDAILKTEEFEKYNQAQCYLYHDQTVALLSRYQSLKEDYLKIKDYPGDIGQQSLKKELQQVQYEMSQNSFIQNYYQAYDQLNDLLEEVTCIVFKNISDDLQIERFQL